MAQKVWIGTTDTSWDTAGNWSPANEPSTSGDSVTMDGRAVKAIAGSDQSGTTLDRLDHYASMQYAVGSAGTMLQVSATACNIGLPTPDGSNKTPGEVAINFGSNQATVNVYTTATTGTSQLPPVLFRGTHANNSMTVHGTTGAAIVGAGLDTPAVAYTIETVNVIGNRAQLNLGSGGTLTTINQWNGTINLQAAATTINGHGGTLNISGAGAITTLNANGGTVNDAGTGTITNLNVGDKGVVDFSGSTAAVTVTNCTVAGGGRINDPGGRVTFTNGIDLEDGASSTQLELGQRTITPS
jgi:hypothetical protein